MSTWRAITEDDIRAALTAPEDEAYRGQLLSAGQTDPLVQIIAQVTVQFRNAIRSCGKNSLHLDATFLPEGGIFYAVAVIRFRLLSRMEVGEQDQPGPARSAEYREALRWLELVRTCKELIEQPYGDGAESGGSEIEVSSDTPARKWTRRQQSGL